MGSASTVMTEQPAFRKARAINELLKICKNNYERTSKSILAETMSDFTRETIPSCAEGVII